MKNADPGSESINIRYQSLPAFREAHTELLKHLQTNDKDQTLVMAKELLFDGIAIGKLLDEPDERREAQTILDFWAVRMYRVGADPPDSTIAEFDPLLAPKLPDSRCPYLGLDAFVEEDASRFFGRHDQITKLIEHLKDHQLLAVVGPSGSGKSSLVRAGVLPALYKGAIPRSTEWHYFPVIVPGSEPLESLARLLHPNPPANATLALQQQPALFAEAIATKYKSQPVVLFIDQFEEAFTLSHEKKIREAFIHCVAALLQRQEARHRVILTMRGDYEQFVAALPDFYELFQRNKFQPAPMSAADLREAIEAPANIVGLRFQKEVVERLVQDIVSEPAGLPLLQFTLLKLWENRDRNRVTEDVYNTVGGGRLALARSADKFYEELKLIENQNTAKRILLRMVQFNEALEVTNKRIRRTELYQDGDTPVQVQPVLNKLIQARLVRLTQGITKEDDQIELAHEALIRNWPRLVDWLIEAHADFKFLKRFTADAERWDAAKRNPDLLWRGSELEKARKISGSLSDIEQHFLSAAISVQAEREEQVRKEAEQKRIRAQREEAAEKELSYQRLLVREQSLRITAERERREESDKRTWAELQRAEAERKRAEEQERRAQEQTQAARQFKRLTTVLIIVSIVAVIAAVFAGIQSVITGDAQSAAQTAQAAIYVARATSNVAQGTAIAAQRTATAVQLTATAAQSFATSVQKNLISAQGTVTAVQQTAIAAQETVNAVQQTVTAAELTVTTLRLRATATELQKIVGPLQTADAAIKTAVPTSTLSP